MLRIIWRGWICLKPYNFFFETVKKNRLGFKGALSLGPLGIDWWECNV